MVRLHWHYSNYIDLDAFVDQHWIVEFPKQIDGYRLSDYFQKDRNGKIKPAPIWDWNLSFGNADYLDGGNTSKWYYAVLNDANAHIWLSRMIGNQPIPNTTLGDPDFIQKIVDRWSVLRTNVMNGERVTNRIDEIARLLTDNSAPEREVEPVSGKSIKKHLTESMSHLSINQHRP